jgi:hypothetical protein
MQGLAPCSGCMDRCYQCAGVGIEAGENCALAWDLGEIYGLTDPSRLPSPTTSSLARTVIMRPEAGTIQRLHIEDAERAQGLPAGYTSLPDVQVSACSQKAVLKTRFRCVGNALPGEVRLRLAVLALPFLLSSRWLTGAVMPQVLGEIFQRMARIRDFPSRLAAADCVALADSQQPGVVCIAEPDGPFPSAGFYRDGVYHAVNGCMGNLVNVRLRSTPRRVPLGGFAVMRRVFPAFAETESEAWGVAWAFRAVGGRARGEAVDATAEEPRAGHLPEPGGHSAVRDDAQPSVLP